LLGNCDHPNGAEPCRRSPPQATFAEDFWIERRHMHTAEVEVSGYQGRAGAGPQAESSRIEAAHDTDGLQVGVLRCAHAIQSNGEQ